MSLEAANYDVYLLLKEGIKVSGRRNIVVIADEAHRSKYDFIDGFAKRMRDALPEASFICLTGTPIESGDKNMQAVSGDLASQARHQLVSQLYDSRCRAPWSLTFTTPCNPCPLRSLCSLAAKGPSSPSEPQGPLRRSHLPSPTFHLPSISPLQHSNTPFRQASQRPKPHKHWPKVTLPSVPSPFPWTLQKRENPCKHGLGTLGRMKPRRAGGEKSTGEAPRVLALPRPQPVSAPDRPSPASRCLVSGFVSIGEIRG